MGYRSLKGAHMPGKIVAHNTHLRIDTEFIELKDCFEAFRRGVEYREKNDVDDILVICNAPDIIEYQLKNGDSFIVTYDPIHRIIVMRVFLHDEDITIKPIYIYNNREYQIACEFLRQIMHDKIDLKDEWIV